MAKAQKRKSNTHRNVPLYHTTVRERLTECSRKSSSSFLTFDLLTLERGNKMTISRYSRNIFYFINQENLTKSKMPLGVTKEMIKKLI